MSYRIFTTKTFDKDFKRCVKRGLPMDLLHEVLKQLAEIGKVDEKYHPHICTCIKHNSLQNSPPTLYYKRNRQSHLSLATPL